MKKIYLLCIVLTILIHNTPAQDYVQRIIPPSPEAASLAKYGDIPVNLYNGLTDITIPVYEIKVRDISVPITLNYHSSGIRVEEEASWVGLGWTLNAGGVITRTVNGNDDFLYSVNHNFKGYIYSYDFALDDKNPWLLVTFLNDICHNNLDLQPDIFYFNFLGHSGKFYIQQKRTPSDPVKVYLLSPEKIQIEYNESTSSWTITTIDGSELVFAEKEYTENWFGSGEIQENPESVIKPPSNEPYAQKIISSWYLTEINSPTGERVVFSYAHTASNQNYYVSKSIVRTSESRTQCTGFGSLISKSGCLQNTPYDNYGIIPMTKGYNGPIDFTCAFDFLRDWMYSDKGMNGSSSSLKGCKNTGSFTSSEQVYYQAFLKRIDFSNGYINFITADRKDIEELKNDSRFPGKYFAKPQCLTGMGISNAWKKLLEVNFNYTYFNDNTTQSPYLFKRLKLNSLMFKNGSEAIPPYIFEYEEKINFPSKDSESRDHWGYFNNADNSRASPAGQPSLIPSIKIISRENTIEEFAGADREPNGNFTRVGILKKITYPAGGSTEFEYENHTFNVDQEKTNLPYKQEILATENKNSIIEIKYPCEVKFIINLKCNSVSCYPNGTEIPCEVPDLNEPYFILLNLAESHEEIKELYADFSCIENPSSQWCTGKNVSLSGGGLNPCGISREITRLLKPGKYLLQIFPVNNINVAVTSMHVQPQQVSVHAQNLLKKGGGLRIKSIRIHDGLNNKMDQIKEYIYDFTDTQGIQRSAGKLMSFPKYSYVEYYIIDEHSGNLKTLLVNLKSSSYSNAPLGTSAQSSPVGYDKVTEITGLNGTGGYSEYYFINEPDLENEPFLPNSPSNSFACKNGLLLKQVDFNKQHFKVREIINEYDAKYIGMITGINLLNYSCGGLDPYIPENYNYVSRFYQLFSEWWFKRSYEERIFNLEDNLNQKYLSQKTVFNYNSDHKLVTYSETTNSQGQKIMHEYKYPLDAKELSPREMWSSEDINYKHMHNQLISESISLNDKGIITKISERTNYYRYDPVTKLILMDHVQLSYNSNLPETRIRFTKYDTKGNILEYVLTGGGQIDNITTSFLWGFNQTFPIAKIENATYEEVLSAAKKNNILETSIQLLNNENDIRKELEKIRNGLPKAQMMIYTLNPYEGITSVTDINGKTNYYTYDDLQRLGLVKDFEQKKISELQYKYQTYTINK